MAFLSKNPNEKDIEKKYEGRCGTPMSFRQSADQRQLPDAIASGAKMAQVGGNDVFCLKIVEIHVAMKKKRCGTLTNIKMLTDQRYEPDITGSGVKMASKWLKNGKNRWKWHV